MDLNPLNQVNALVIVSIIVIFAATFLGLRRWFFLPYIEVMEERAAQVEAADARLAEASRMLAAAEAAGSDTVARAHERAESIMRESHDRVVAYRRQTVDAAVTEASAELESGRRPLAAMREKEVRALRGQAIDCVNQACARLHVTVDGQVAPAVDRILRRRGLETGDGGHGGTAGRDRG